VSAATVPASSGKGGLGRTVARGGFWVMMLRVFHQVLQLVKLVVLGRLLTTADFGLLSIALTISTAALVFTETGFENALIQRQDDVRPYLNSAWTMLVMRGALIAAVLFVGAPLAASFFREPGATPIIQGIAVALLIDGFLNVGVVFFKKNLDFRRFATLELSGYLADAILSIAAAVVLRNAWALVIGRVGGSVLRTGVSYLVSDHRPRFDFNKEHIKELFSFGKWMLGSSVLVFALTQGDNMVVGRVLGASALGLYAMAYRFSCLPATEITSMVSQVMFPVFSKLQTDKQRLGDAYERVLMVVSLLAFLLAAVVFALAYETVDVFLGAKWLGMVPAIYVLVWYGVFRGLAGSMTPLFMSIGQPRQVTTQQFWQAVIMFVLIVPLTKQLSVYGPELGWWGLGADEWGLVGTASAVFISAAAVFFARIGRLSRALGWRQWRYYRQLVTPVLAAAAGIAATFGAKQATGSLGGIVELVTLGLVFAVAFGLVALIGDRVMGLGMLKTARQTLEQVRRKKEQMEPEEDTIKHLKHEDERV